MKGGLMDLEAESTRIKVDTDVTSDIATSCNKLLELQTQMQKCEEHLKSLHEEERLLSEQEIPNLMQKAGISMLKLADGSSVEIKPFYAAKIPVSKTDEAFKWLRDKGFGDIIKNNVTVTFGKAQDNAARVIYEDLKSAGHNVIQKEKVESSTLKAFVREQIENGKDVPMDLFGVYVANKTKIKGEK
jgi:hypothetical protein